jgi:hypothetical protein
MTIIEGTELLPKLGREILWEGAKDILVELC